MSKEVVTSGLYTLKMIKKVLESKNKKDDYPTIKHILESHYIECLNQLNELMPSEVYNYIEMYHTELKPKAGMMLKSSFKVRNYKEFEGHFLQDVNSLILVCNTYLEQD